MNVIFNQSHQVLNVCQPFCVMFCNGVDENFQHHYFRHKNRLLHHIACITNITVFSQFKNILVRLLQAKTIVTWSAFFEKLIT